MLAVMKAKLDASRALLYETARFVDIYKAYDDIAKERTLTPEERKEAKAFSRKADACTPLVKGMGSEYCNQNAYDAIQIHGGSGFMKDYACERVYRDARITSIYEGTTQLQVVAAIRHVTTGTYLSLIREYEAQPVKESLKGIHDILVGLTENFEKAVQTVTEAKNQEYLDFMARRLVEMAGNIIMAYLLLGHAEANESFTKSCEVYTKLAQSEVDKHCDFIANFSPAQIDCYKA